MNLFLHKYRRTAIGVVSLILLLFIAVAVDRLMSFPDNPITYVLLVLFMVGLVHLLIPAFIIKYWRIIVLFYIPLLLFFSYIRLSSGNLQAYLQVKDDINLLFLLIPVPLILGGCLWIYDQWKWIKTIKADQTRTELSLLKTQINPHFFFNTLNNLYALTIKNSDQAPEIILKLSDLMRYTIYEGKKDVVPIKAEINYLENYIELNKIRYHKSVTIQFQHEIEEGDTIAPLLFIILLENAIKHGIEYLMKDAYVKMHLRSNAKEVHFTIENNFEAPEIPKEKGIGLENLKHRLSLIYPKRHELKIMVKDNVYLVDLKIKKHD